jgi:putative transposase
VPGAWHHVMNRGAGRRVVFRDDSERLLFLLLIADFETRFDVEVHCFCLMGNHFHLLVRSKSGNLSAAMSWLGSKFTRAVNAERGVDGAVFRGRFHSVLIDREAHLDWLYRYINANPIELGWNGPLASYPWSGLGATLGYNANYRWLRTDYARSRFGEDPQHLERFVDNARLADNGHRLIGVTDADVAAAVRTACGAGPRVNSEAQIRAAHTVVGHHVGIAPSNLTTMSHLAPKPAAKYIAQVLNSSCRPGALSALVSRTTSILTLEQRLLHSVPDTERIGWSELFGA